MQKAKIIDCNTPIQACPQDRQALASLIARRAFPAATAISGLLLAGAAQAASIDVTAGAVDNVNNGNCSLVEAITAANTDTAVDQCPAGDGADTLNLPTNSVFTFTDYISSAFGHSALPPMESIITIAGDGAVIERSAAPATPGFRIAEISDGGDLRLQDLTLRNGLADAAGGSSSQRRGGALLVSAGNLSLERCTVSGNSAIGRGGGIATQSPGIVTIVETSVSGNSTVYNGGGIDVTQGTLSVNRSTVSGNYSGSRGGGVFVARFDGDGSTTADIFNSTISGNTASLRGGGMEIFVDSAVSIRNSTVTANTALDSASGIFSLNFPSTTTEIRASLISGNANDDDVDTNTSNPSAGSFSSLGDNLIGGGDASVAFDQPGDITGVLPELAALADNGGETLTHLPQVGSPVIDAVVGSCPSPGSDQRLIGRPQDGDNNGSAICDIGAVELTPPIEVIDGEITPIANGRCSLVEAIDNANDTTDGNVHADCQAGSIAVRDQIDLPNNGTFSFKQAYASVSGYTALPAITSALTIQGSRSKIERQSGDNDFRLVLVSGTGDLILNDLTLTNGLANTAGYGDDGGAALNLGGDLVLNRVTVSGNTAEANGGAIATFFGGLQVNRSSLTGNAAVQQGGAIYSFTNNEISSVINNSTISGNTVGLTGGALSNARGLTEITYSTITENKGVNGNRPGIVSASGNATETRVGASIVSANTRLEGGNSTDVVTNGDTNEPTFTSLGDNLIGGGDAANLFNQDGDITGIDDPLLGPLASNGGSTQNHLPELTSLALDAVTGVCPATGTDQRGQPRQIDGDFTLGPQCDIGAVELAQDNTDGDDDGIPDAYEVNNGLDTTSNDADGDRDGDGLVNSLEFMAGLAANNPDSDGDILGDHFDLDPANDSNACTPDFSGPEGAMQFDATASAAMTTQCGSRSQITIRSTAVVEAPNAALELYAPAVIFDPEVTVPLGPQLQIKSVDPVPGAVP